MNLQNTFYIMGIAFMALNILLLLGIVVLLFYIKKKVTNIYDNVEAKLDELADFATSPVRKTVDALKSLLPGGSKRISRRN